MTCTLASVILTFNVRHFHNHNHSLHNFHFRKLHFNNFHFSPFWNFQFQMITFTQSKPGSHCECTSHGYCSSNNFSLSQCLILFLQVSLSQCSIPKLSQFSPTWELLSRDSALLLLLTELRDKERSLKVSDFLTCIKIMWLTLNRSS